jgi:hypothetical protein
MRRIIAAFAIAGLVGVAACEADRETQENTGADLGPPPAVEAARENPVNPTGAALGDQDTVGMPGSGGVVQDTGTGMPTDTMR